MKNYAKEDKVRTGFAEEGFLCRPDLQGQIVQSSHVGFLVKKVDGLGINVYAIDFAVTPCEFSGRNSKESLAATNVDEC
jgi:hypothetical protein